MASYKQPCIHCGTFIESDSRFCPACQSGSPFGYLCPTCLRPIQKGQSVCSSCGRPLAVPCPNCGEQTFVQDRCEQCGGTLMIRCPNPRCGAPQFFENTKCTACGKKIELRKKCGYDLCCHLSPEILKTTPRKPDSSSLSTVTCVKTVLKAASWNPRLIKRTED